ncbi:ESPR domain-containing protein [Morganella morganii]|nr:ESPR domain-containing protein [Morganella morganii]
MNKIFKVVKNQRTGNSVVASEFAKGAKKGKNWRCYHWQC